MKNPFYINPNVLNVYKELKKNDKPDEKVKKQTEIYWNALNKNLAAFCLAYPGNGSRENNCKETVKNYTNDFNLSYDENRIIKELSNVYAASGVISDSLIAFSCKLYPHIDQSFYEIMEVNVFDCNAVNQYLIENEKCANSDSTYIQEFSSGIKYICEGKKWRNLKFNEIKNGICSSEGELKNGLYCVKKLGWIKTPDYKNFIDERDGQTYRAVKIGNQIWMAENLNYRVMDSYCYENEKDNCDKYGRLYTWYSIMSMNNNGCLEEKNNCSEKTQIQGICPDGWHLPSKNEFENLIENAKKNGSLINALRSADGWLDGKNGANILGFNAYPVNSWNPAGFFGKNGFGTDFWSSSRITGTYSVEPRAYNFVVGDSDSHSGLSYNFMRETSYVRCIKDSKPKPDKNDVKKVGTKSSYASFRTKQAKQIKEGKK